MGVINVDFTPSYNRSLYYACYHGTNYFMCGIIGYKKRSVTSLTLEVNKKDVICLIRCKIVGTKLKYLIYWGLEDISQYEQYSPLLVESDFMLYVTIQ